MGWPVLMAPVADPGHSQRLPSDQDEVIGIQEWCGFQNGE